MLAPRPVFGDHLGVYRRLLRNGALVRALLSFGAAYTAEWAFTVAISLVAFANGGAVAVGLVGLLRLVPAALLAPAVAAYADRLPREHVLVASSLVRGVATLLTAPVLLADGPTWVVYALAVVSTIAFTPYRASHSALMPQLCRTPEELTSINVVRGVLDSLSVIIGPFVAAVLVAVSDVAAVFVFAGVSGIISALLVLGLRYERVPGSVTRRNLRDEVREGMAAVRRTPASAWCSSSWCCRPRSGAPSRSSWWSSRSTCSMAGSPAWACSRARWASEPSAAASCCNLLVGSRAMTRWLGIAVVLWGVPMAVMGLVPEYAVALSAAAVVGVGNSLVDVTAFTLIARMVPDAVLARVFGVAGERRRPGRRTRSLVAPILVETIGARAALVVVGAVAPVACALFWRRAARVDSSVACAPTRSCCCARCRCCDRCPSPRSRRWPRTPSTRRSGRAWT